MAEGIVLLVTEVLSLIQTIYVLYNNGNNEIYNFNIDDKKSLQDTEW